MARKKSIAEVEAQIRRLRTANMQREMREGFNNRTFERSKTISKAAENVRKSLGYERTGKMTRNSDEIFKRSNGKMFTYQNGRIVEYRGKQGALGMSAG
jgi:NCAIR mutase (PurE)-related protein